jgi:hypothetical protein
MDGLLRSTLCDMKCLLHFSEDPILKLTDSVIRWVQKWICVVEVLNSIKFSHRIGGGSRIL